MGNYQFYHVGIYISSCSVFVVFSAAFLSQSFDVNQSNITAYSSTKALDLQKIANSICLTESLYNEAKFGVR